MMLKGPRTPPIICTIDLSGFVVVMAMVVFTLMVAIMSWPHPHIGVSVNMPKAHFPVSMLRENREDAMVIMITRDGKVYFDLNSVTPDMLPA